MRYGRGPSEERILEDLDLENLPQEDFQFRESRRLAWRALSLDLSVLIKNVLWSIEITLSINSWNYSECPEMARCRTHDIRDSEAVI